MDLIEDVAKRTPSAPAVRGSFLSLTYAELWQAARALAAQLVSEDIGAGDLVAIHLHRSPEAIVVLLGVLISGAGYLPLNPEHPTSRNDSIVELSGAKRTLAETDLPIISGLIKDKTIVSGQELSFSRDHDSTAYVIYTSGTTGIPKGVVVSHDALMRFVYRQTYADDIPDYRRLHISPYNFDASIIEVWSTLAAGACVVIPDASLDFLHQVRQGVHDLGADTALFVSPQLHALVDRDPEVLSQLSSVQVGGANLSVEHAKHAVSLLPKKAFYHVYGPTESTLFATSKRIDASSDFGRSLPIGVPIANTRAYVLDADLRPVGPQVEGDLYLAGPGLAAGYINDPVATAQAFLPDPYAVQPGDRMYFSGDRAMWDAHEELIFRGRLDTQVKIRGYRIELEEIENNARKCAGVTDAAVIYNREAPGGEALEIFYVAAANSSISTKELREYLESVMPSYMVPSFIHQIPNIPLTSNSKVDRAALIAQSKRTASVRTEVLVERPEDVQIIMQRIVAVWNEVLGIETPINLETDYFSIGGNSLNLLDTHARLRAELPESSIELIDLFSYSTLRELTEFVLTEAGTPRRKEES